MRELSYYIGRPIRSLQTMLRTLSKTREGQPSVIPDGVYGNDTVRAVSAFQRQENVPVTGVTESNTWRRIVAAYKNEAPLVLPAAPLEIIWEPLYKIRPGEKNVHLYIIQAMIAALREVFVNVPCVGVTGVHDTQTVQAVSWLQERSGRPITGEIDQMDWLYLTKLYRITAGDGRPDLTSSQRHSHGEMSAGVGETV